MAECLKLITSDGKDFDVLLAVMTRFSSMLRTLIEDSPNTSKGVPLPNVTGARLERLVEYCNYHAVNDTTTTAPSGAVVVVDPHAYVKPTISTWDGEWCKRAFYRDAGAALDLPECIAMTEAANYLDIAPAMELIKIALQRYAIACSSPEILYRQFGLIDRAQWYDEDENNDVCARVWELAPKLRGL